MRALGPIPLRLLAEDAVVRVPDGAGGYAEGVAVSHVRFARTQSVVDDEHRSADAGSGKIYVDAVNSDGAFEVPAGSQCFYSCSTSLVGGNGTVWASNKTAYTYFRIDAAGTPRYITAS